MKIIDTRTIKQNCFGTIKRGGTFIYHDKLYIKIHPSDDINAVMLGNGCGAFFDESDFVAPVECEVKIFNQ